jgi:exonuclease SbcC
MKLKDVHICNFQSHVNSHITFHPGVNVIVGPTDSGKTAVFRALQWLFTNRPGGDHFRTRGGGDTEVHVNFEDGAVSRIRNKKFNGYVMGGNESIGLPDDILEFFNMSPINFQNQLDSHFMLSLSPGQRGAMINEIANLNIIDSAVSRIKSIKSQEERDLRQIEGQISAAEAELDQYYYLDEMDEELTYVEEQAHHVEKLQTDVKKLKQFSAAIVHDSALLKDCEKILELAPEVDAAVHIVNRLTQGANEIDKFRQILGSIYSLQNRIEEARENAKRFEEQFKTLMPEICPLCEK